jgi:hypothetical protein
VKSRTKSRPAGLVSIFGDPPSISGSVSSEMRTEWPEPGSHRDFGYEQSREYPTLDNTGQCETTRMERAMGIEPTAQAWEAWVLPLYDARSRQPNLVAADSSRLSSKQANRAPLKARAPFRRPCQLAHWNQRTSRRTYSQPITATSVQ